MQRTFKFRLYPSLIQKSIFVDMLTTCRHLYNDALAERNDAWEKEKKSVSYNMQAMSLTLKKVNNPFLLKVHSQTLQDVLRRLDKSFKAFFRRVKAGENPGHPRFKGANRYDSFIYPQSGFRMSGKKLVLSKIGPVNIKLHRPIQGIIKTCTIRKDVDKWHVCFSVEMPDVTEQVPIKSSVGIDLGLKSLVALSTGEHIEPPKFLRHSEEKLAKEQRKLSRKKNGSQNRAKQRIEVAKLHRKIRDQRTDFNHKLSRILVNNYDLIAFERLQIPNMMQNHCLAKSISDASWSQLQNFTAYKAEGAGKFVEFVAPQGTTKECSSCGMHFGQRAKGTPFGGDSMQLGLADRVFKCDCCGLVLDRDQNAAKNILSKAVRPRIGREPAEMKPAPSAECGVGGLSIRGTYESGSPVTCP